MSETALDPMDTVVWTTAAFRARDAHQRQAEFKAQMKAELERRDRAIREAVEGGAKIPKLANMVGLSQPGIYRVLGVKA